MKRLLVVVPLFALVFIGWIAGWVPDDAAAKQPTKRPTDEERGEELYRRHCVACHGVRNGGQGPATTALVHPVPALQGKVTTKNDHVHVVLKGKGAMPGFEASFDRPDAVRVLKYMRSLGPDKALPSRSERAKPDKKRPLPRKPVPPRKGATEGPDDEESDEDNEDVDVEDNEE